MTTHSKDIREQTDIETTGFICDVGYSMEHYFKNRGKCEVCNKNGTLIWESGWNGSRILHQLKSCRGYFEIDDGGLCWKRQVTLEVFDIIVADCERALERDERDKDRTGRKCHTCDTTRGIGYYGMYPDPLICFCKPHHTEWLGSPEYDKWRENR